ncbi:hypothetical protein GCM10010230_31880 [Streptomyces narbonensis]|uniref:DUF6232 family protein n=1 Tax=Streptomyces narbonensis TaxID=67333 RepID=UPI0019ABE129|nr:DUF6232 family protein [Streptomyces narbonensis]GGW01451.1 hypothetical protein GCM10010230_31880 [Streptomyces narbonensis]
MARHLPLVISKRLLWVGGAAYPLENIVRVYTFVLRPRKAEAFRRFLKRIAFTLLALILVLFFGAVADTLSSSSDGDDFASFLSGLSLLAVVGAFIWFAADMLVVVTASAHYVLAIETNGQSTAMVAGEPRHLDGLVGQIAAAIDEPDANLSVVVGALSISNPSNYYFGDAVNIYGGSGHTGKVGA